MEAPDSWKSNNNKVFLLGRTVAKVTDEIILSFVKGGEKMISGSQQILAQTQTISESRFRDNPKEVNSFMDFLCKSLNSSHASNDTGKASANRNTRANPAQPARRGRELTQKTTATSASTDYEARAGVKAVEIRRTIGDGENTGMEAVSERSDTEQVKENPPGNDELLKKSEDIQTIMDEIIAILQEFSFLTGETQTGSGSETVQATVSWQEAVQLKQSLEVNLEKLMRIGKLDNDKTSEIAIDYAERLTQVLSEVLAELPENEAITIQNPGRLKELVGKMLNETEYAKMQVAANTINEAVAYEKQVVTASGSAQVPADSMEQTEKVPAAIQKEPDGDNGSKAFSGKREENTGQEMNGGKALTAAAPRYNQRKPVSAESNAESIPISGEFSHPTQDPETVSEGIAKAPVILKEDVLQQVVEKADTLHNEGKSELIIQLKPESLGKISLRVIHERGEIIARFVTENEQVKAVLESNMQFLRDSLQRNGVSVQSLSVSVGQHDQRQGSGSRDGWNEEPESDGRVTQVETGRTTAIRAYMYRGLDGDVLQPGESEINLIA